MGAIDPLGVARRTPGALSAEFMQGTIRQSYIVLNISAVGLMVSEDFLYFSHCKSMGLICCHGYQSSNEIRPNT